MNTRRAAAALRRLADLDDEAARLAQERARTARALAEALEDPEEPPAPVRRRRGRGSLLLPPMNAPCELDQRRARSALEDTR